jgi:hypothetical protein
VTSATEYDSHDSVLPLFRSTGSKESLEQFASAVLFQDFGETFLITAAHVADELERGVDVLAPTTEGQFLPLRFDYRLVALPPNVLRQEDRVDVAYIRLPRPFDQRVLGAFKAVPHSRIRNVISDVFDDPRPTHCSVVGYPITKARFKNSAHQIDVWSYVGVLVKDRSVYARLGYDAESNVIVRHRRKKTVQPHRQDFVEKAAPNLRGVSGGGIFALPDYVGSILPIHDRKLVGIFHTYLENEGVAIGTSLFVCRTMIALGKQVDRW